MIVWLRTFGYGRKSAGIDNPTTGYSRAPGLGANTHSGRMRCYRKSFNLRHCERGSTSKLGGIPFDTHFSTMLIANGENVKVVQELMRHASSRCTLEVYSQARILATRQAQQRVVEMIVPKEADAPDALFAC